MRRYDRDSVRRLWPPSAQHGHDRRSPYNANARANHAMTGEAMEAKPSVALLGLGTMGHGMAMNLLKAGFPLTVWNRTRAKAEPLAQTGATVAESSAGAAKNAAVVIAMLADDAASRAAWLGERGALAAMGSESIAVECSTLSPEWIAELHIAVANRGLRMVEAPVTGSR